MNIILDLDNTLICSINKNQYNNIPPEILYNYNYDTKNPFGLYMFERPNLKFFLNSIKNHGVITVWTAATDDYARYVIETFFPSNMRIHNLFSRDFTTKVHKQTNLLKPLSYLSVYNYNLNRTIIVDDLPGVLDANPYNCIPVKPFDYESILNKDYTEDNELIKTLNKIKNINYNLQRF